MTKLFSQIIGLQLSEPTVVEIFNHYDWRYDSIFINGQFYANLHKELSSSYLQNHKVVKDIEKTFQIQIADVNFVFIDLENVDYNVQCSHPQLSWNSLEDLIDSENYSDYTDFFTTLGVQEQQILCKNLLSTTKVYDFDTLG